MHNLVTHLRSIATTCVVIYIRIVSDIDIISTNSNDTPMPVVIRQLSSSIYQVECLAQSKVIYSHRVIDSASISIFLTEVTSPRSDYSFNLRDDKSTSRVHYLTLDLRGLHNLNLFCGELTMHVQILCIKMPVTFFILIDGYTRLTTHRLTKHDTLHESSQ